MIVGESLNLCRSGIFQSGSFSCFSDTGMQV